MSNNLNINIHQLRGLCALNVFISHVLSMIPNIIFDKFSSGFFHIFFDGNCAVFVFFAITGFFAKNRMYLNLKKAANIIVRKLVKLYPPPHIIMSILAFILCNMQLATIPNVYTAWGESFWINGATIHDLLNTILVFPNHDTNILNPPIWYLSIEFKAVFFLPLIIYILNYSTWWLLILIVAMPFVGIDYFLIYIPYLFGSLGGKIKVPIEKIPSVYLIFGVIVGLLFLNIKNYCCYELSSYITLLSQSIGSAIIVFSVFYMKVTFKSQFLIFMGTISYEFYLVHFVILLTLRSLVNNISMLLLLSFAISLSLSIILHKINHIIKREYESFI